MNIHCHQRSPSETGLPWTFAVIAGRTPAGVPFGTLDNAVKFSVRLFGGSVLNRMLNPTRAVLEQRDMTMYVL